MIAAVTISILIVALGLTFSTALFLQSISTERIVERSYFCSDCEITLSLSSSSSLLGLFAACVVFVLLVMSLAVASHFLLSRSVKTVERTQKLLDDACCNPDHLLLPTKIDTSKERDEDQNDMRGVAPTTSSSSASRRHHEKNLFDVESLSCSLSDMKMIRNVKTLFEKNGSSSCDEEQQKQKHQYHEESKLDAALKSRGWVFQSSKHGFKYFNRPSPFCDITAALFYAFIPHVGASDVQIVLDEPSKHYEFDKVLEKRTLIERSENGREVWRNECKTLVPFVKPRDTVCERIGIMFLTSSEDGIIAQKTGLPSDVFFVSSRSASQSPRQMSEKTPQAYMLFADDDGTKHVAEEPDRYQRCIVHACIVSACEQVRATDGVRGVLFLTMMNVDPCGMIPASLVNIGLSAGFDRVHLQRDEFVKEARTKELHKIYGYSS